MIKIIILTGLCGFLSCIYCSSQTTSDSIKASASKELKGVLLDADTHLPLPYANIAVLHTMAGSISNEQGHFSINITNLDRTDTISFHYIGYEKKSMSILELDSLKVVYLKEEAFNLSEILVFGREHDPKEIVKKILENKGKNYKRSASKKQVFIRDRSVADTKFKIKFKKSSFDQIDKELVDKVARKLPEHTTSYTDFLGDLYYSQSRKDSISLKIAPIRIVSLKEKEVDDFDQIETIFEDYFAKTKEKEYWKIKSGIIGTKLDVDEEQPNEADDSLTDMYKNYINVDIYRKRLNYRFAYCLLDDKDDWEFLYKTGKYEYTFVGGTRVNGEDVYIIDFKPKKKGKYKGRVFVSIETYALIRADYAYESGRTGTDIHLFGIGYSENYFSGSIYFEKKNNNYNLKYFSLERGTTTSIDRNLQLLKKRKRFLWDKTLNEVKVAVDITVIARQSVEVLIMNQMQISNKEFTDFNQKRHAKIINVDQFDDNLWKDYSIIEPTERIRDYKKRKI